MNYYLILFLSVLSMLTALSIDIYLPTVSNIAASLHATPQAVSASLGIFLFSYAFGQLLYGPLSDRFGRLKMLSLGLGLYSVVSFLCALSITVGQFHFLRFLQGLFACCGPITAFAVVADVFDRERIARANAYVDIVSELAPMTAPLLGTWLASAYGWRSCFLFLGSLGLALLVLAPRWFRRLPVTATPRTFPEIARGYGEMLRSALFRRYLLANTFAFCALMIFISQSPHLFMTELGLSAAEFSRLFGLNAAMLAVGAFGAAKLTTRWGIDGCISFGAGLVTIAGGLLLLYCASTSVYTVAPVMGICLLSTLGVAFLLPNSAAGGISVFRHLAGTSSAFLGFSRFGVSGILCAILPSLPLRHLTGFAVGITLCGIIVLLSRRLAHFSFTQSLVAPQV